MHFARGFSICQGTYKSACSPVTPVHHLVKIKS
ncbi:LADA_0D06458g1_1 [Lachancea dasiensis]|uniref:LADA_0D06458g1_1 n=1 Tax=Lachancea dasiensis TaxID=1072105 RepID=A0A1G4J609_9SACH|nr:LADA_0D06458g1_1 [Lachancea dasiensis]